MSAALFWGLLLFVLVAAIIGTRAWLRARPAAVAEHSPQPVQTTLEEDQEDEITVIDNVIVISDWKAERDRRRNEPSADVG